MKRRKGYGPSWWSEAVEKSRRLPPGPQKFLRYNSPEIARLDSDAALRRVEAIKARATIRAAMLSKIRE